MNVMIMRESFTAIRRDIAGEQLPGIHIEVVDSRTATGRGGIDVAFYVEN